MYSYEDYRNSADAIDRLSGSFSPEILLVLGSGLGFMGELCENSRRIKYSDIPGFSASTAPGHAGQLILGELGGKRVCIMQGRVHYYEGYSMNAVALPVRVARLLGADKMIVTNAAGGVNASFQSGDIMMINDHIKLFGDSPLRGDNIEKFGPRFNDMTDTYTPRLRDIATTVAKKSDIPLQHGVYMFFTGPQYETPAEIRAARILGADAVGMSTVPEVIAARHCGMEILGFSLITNLAAGMSNRPLSEKEVLESAEAAREKFSSLILGCLGVI